MHSIPSSYLLCAYSVLSANRSIPNLWLLQIRSYQIDAYSSPTFFPTFFPLLPTFSLFLPFLPVPDLFSPFPTFSYFLSTYSTFSTYSTYSKDFLYLL